MKISGFSYIRNGFRYGYPFLQAMQSILPLCDEFIMAVGNSDDGTREAIEDLGNKKIKIIDTVWDEELRVSGKIFAQQCTTALRHATGDWAFHVQADEIIHEDDLEKIYSEMQKADGDERVEGLLFDFLNFHGNYYSLNNTRYQHRKEIRVIRNGLNIYSYKDSQGFRKYASYKAYMAGEKGEKLHVKYIGMPVYHYSHVRRPEAMNEKAKYFERFWHDDSYVETKYKEKKEFDYYNIERISRFTGKHPAIMKEIIERENWDYNPARIHKKPSFRDKILYAIEDVIQYRIGEYRNYKIVK